LALNLGSWFHERNEMKSCFSLLVILSVLAMAGCAPAIVGAGAAGGYKVGTDERSVGQMWDDATITARIKAEMIRDPLVKARKIDVDTVQQIVTLTGVVESEAESEKAVSLARKVPYVKDVRNYIQIGRKSLGQSLDDKVIGSKIKARLIKENNVRSLNIDVDVVKGVVTLTGVVGSPAQEERVLKIARTTPGVIKVTDNLLVREGKAAGP